MAGIQEVVEAFDKGTCIIVTSMLTKVELLASKLGEENYKKLTLLWKRKQLQSLDVTERIIDLANEIRNFYSEKGQKAPQYAGQHPPRHGHHCQSGRFPNFRRRRQARPATMDGNVAGYNLAIKTPFYSQIESRLSAAEGNLISPGLGWPP